MTTQNKSSNSLNVHRPSPLFLPQIDKHYPNLTKNSNKELAAALHPPHAKTSPAEVEEVFDDSRLKTEKNEVKLLPDHAKHRIYLHRYSLKKRNHITPSQLRSDRKAPTPPKQPGSPLSCHPLAQLSSQRQGSSFVPEKKCPSSIEELPTSMVNEWKIEQLSRNLLHPNHPYHSSHCSRKSEQLESSLMLRPKHHRRDPKHIFRDRVGGRIDKQARVEKEQQSRPREGVRKQSGSFNAWDNVDIFSSNKAGIIEYARNNLKCLTEGEETN